MEFIASNTEMISKLIIAVLLLAFMMTTSKAIAKGIAGGIKMSKEVISGTSIEEIRNRERDEYERRKEEEKAILKSKIYKVLHPLDYINSILGTSLLKLLKKEGSDNGKATK